MRALPSAARASSLAFACPRASIGCPRGVRLRALPSAARASSLAFACPRASIGCPRGVRGSSSSSQKVLRAIALAATRRVTFWEPCLYAANSLFPHKPDGKLGEKAKSAVFAFSMSLKISFLARRCRYFNHFIILKYSRKQNRASAFELVVHKHYLVRIYKGPAERVCAPAGSNSNQKRISFASNQFAALIAVTTSSVICSSCASLGL